MYASCAHDRCAHSYLHITCTSKKRNTAPSLKLRICAHHVHILIYTSHAQARSNILLLDLRMFGTNKIKTKQYQVEKTLGKTAELAIVKSGRPVFSTDLAKLECTKHIDGKTETVPLSQGPAGFLVADFASGMHATELCNLLASTATSCPAAKAATADASNPGLRACSVVQKKPAAANLKKKPAKCSSRFSIMWYKKSTSIGIREKFGLKRQIFSFGAGSGKSEFVQKRIALAIVSDLEGGMPYDEARDKARASVAA